MGNQGQQSPIDILGSYYVPDFGDGKLKNIVWNDSAHEVQGVVVQGDHGLKIEFHVPTNVGLTLNGKPYWLKQFHFHHPSEHYIQGELRDVELHIVHQNIVTNEYAVLAVMIQCASRGRVPAMFDGLLECLSDMRKANCRRSTEPITIIPSEWLPTNIDTYYRYEGSLTTDPFCETVSWVVFNHSKKIGRKRLEELIGCFGHHARQLEPINRRFVLRNFD